MGVRRFGVTLAAGVAVVEEPSKPAIQVASLGNTAYTAILKKGPIGKVFRTGTRTEMDFRAGGIIAESLGPDSGQAFFRRSKGAGSIWWNRITDGSEKTAYLPMLNRKSPKGAAFTVSAGNGGRWGGKKQLLVKNYASVTATTVTLSSPPSGLKKNELVGAQVVFSAVPGKSFKVVSNTSLGVLTFASDVDLVAEINGSGNMLLSISLGNEGEAIAIKIMEGTTNPTEEFRMQVYFIEGGLSDLKKDFDDLSSDPDADNYYARVINDDSDAEFTIKVVDDYVGSVTSSIRPANYSNVSLSVSATVLTAKITSEYPTSAQMATALANSLVLGGSVASDRLTLTVTTAGARALGTATFAANPADGDTILINGKTMTFKTVVVTPASQILIGASASATIDNTVAFINASTDVLLKNIVFAEKASASTMNVYKQNAGVAGNSVATPAGAGSNPPTWGTSTLAGGVNQVWSVASANLPGTFPSLTTGVAYSALHEYAFGFTLLDTTRVSTKTWQLADTLEIAIEPFEVNSLIGGSLLPKASTFRSKFTITGNTANTVTVKTGSDMTSIAIAGDEFRVEYLQQLAGGYDGVEDVSDLQYQNAYDSGLSPLKGMRNRNLGLVKLGTPGVTSTVAQKAGVSFAEGQNWQYRYEIPANIVSESAADEYVNETLGRNDFGVVSFPTYAYVIHPSGKGLKLISQIGQIHGAEARVAADFQGYHKAAAGEDVTLPDIVKLPLGLEDKALDEEFLNPLGINVIKKISGNFVLWGDRSVSIDPAFKFKHQREVMSHWENTFLEKFNFIVFALNNKGAQTRLISAFLAFFQPEYARGAIEGKNLQDAVRLKIDAENNTDSTRANGDVFAEMSPDIVDTVERLTIKISKRGVEEKF